MIARFVSCAVCGVGALLATVSLNAQTPLPRFEILHPFPERLTGLPSGPRSGLIKAPDGNFYGSTQFAGTLDPLRVRGTIFRLTPLGEVTYLYSFSDYDYSGGEMAFDGEALYGLADGYNSGSHVFRYNLDGSIQFLPWNYTRRHLMFGSDGRIYAYRFMDQRVQVCAFTVTGMSTLLHAFEANDPALSTPVGRLVEGRDGNFYGSVNGNFGGIIKVSPQGGGEVLVRFQGANGKHPRAGLALGSDGFMYGTTAAGGSNDVGTFFKIDSDGELTTLYHFTPEDGSPSEESELVERDGLFYGSIGSQAFEASPSGSVRVLRFENSTHPLNRMVVGNDGNLYGSAAVHDGDGTGNLFRIVFPANPPAIQSGPADQRILLNGSVTFQVTATGTAPLSYQWLRGDSPIENATSSSFTIQQVQATDDGVYSVTIRNSAGEITSNPARLTVVTPPSITAQPGNITVHPGTAGTLTVSVGGTGPFTYQWFRDGAEIDGANSATLTLLNADATAAARYTVTIHNDAGTVTSQTATVSLLDIDIYPGLTITGPVGGRYRIDFAREASPDNWTPLAEVTLPESPYTFSDYSAPLGARRFYRAILLQ